MEIEAIPPQRYYTVTLSHDELWVLAVALDQVKLQEDNNILIAALMKDAIRHILNPPGPPEKLKNVNSNTIQCIKEI